MARLSAKGRSKVSQKNFAIPSKAKTSDQKKKSGNYPIPDKSHARAALSLVAKHGTPAEKARVRAAVKRKFPDVGKSKSKKK